MRKPQRKANKMPEEYHVSDSKTDSQRLDKLEYDVAGLKGRMDEVDTRTRSMDDKLDKILLNEANRPKPREPGYWITAIGGSILIAASLMAAANWYIRSTISETVGIQMERAAHKTEMLGMRLQRLENAFSWTPKLVDVREPLVLLRDPQ